MYFLKQSWWYDTVLCYSTGVLYSLWREKIEKFINKNQIMWIACLLISALLTVLLTLHPFNIVGMILRNIVFVIMVVVLTMRVQLHNHALAWCGTNLFSIYMLQRIPMIVFDRVGLMYWNVYMAFILCFISTLLLVVVYSKIKSVGKQK